MFKTFITGIAPLLAVICVSGVSQSAWPMTKDQILRVEKMEELHETQPGELTKTLEWLAGLEKENPMDPQVFASEAELYFFKATDNSDKKERVKIYQQSIDIADKALSLDDKNVVANFWKAASLGKQGLDVGVTKSLRGAPMMKKHLEVVLAINEKYALAGAYRALGRLYYELPGWPISFGDNKKSLEYLKKSVELAPESMPNHVFYAQVLLKKFSQKEEAKKQLDLALAMKTNPNHEKEFSEYREIAEGLKKKL